MLMSFLVGSLGLCLAGLLINETNNNSICSYRELKDIRGTGIKLSENSRIKRQIRQKYFNCAKNTRRIR